MTQSTLSTKDSTPYLAPLDREPAIVSRTGWWWIVILGVLFGGLHLTYLERLLRIVTHAQGENAWQLLISALTSKWNPDWSHAMVIPLISFYFIYQSRGRFATAVPRVCWWGLAIFSFGLISYTWWIFPGSNDMFQGVSMIVALFGLVLFLLGPAIIRIVWFPIVYLLFTVKIADAIWEQIAWKMQQIASATSYVTLKFFTLVINFETERDGNHITLSFMRGGQWVSEKMNVAEACSGLRMLMAFIALAVALAFMSPRPPWQRALMIVVAVPVAILVNVGRVTVIGLLYLVNPEMAQGDFHTFVGMLMLIPAAGLILLIGWCANKIFLSDTPALPASRSPKQVAPSQVRVDPEESGGGLVSMAQGVVLGVVLVAILGATYSGMWYAGRMNLLENLPHKMLIGVMLATMVTLSLGVAMLGRQLLIRLVTGHRVNVSSVAGLAAGMLLAAWIGQSSVVAATKVVLIKKAVPTRQNLVMVPTRIGPWEMQIDEREQMSKDIIEVLGTTNFISRYYLDTSVEQPPGGGLGRGNFTSGSLARIHVAYYTGNPDTVPHVPDRCFLAGGATGTQKAYPTLVMDDPKFILDDRQNPKRGYFSPIASNPFVSVRVPSTHIPVTRFTYLPSPRAAQQNVIYFFAANGKYLASPNEVRAQGFDPRDKYAYYCKIEINLPGISDPQEAERRTTDLLELFLPEIMACLPDWVEVTEGRWPSDSANSPAALSRFTQP